MATKQYTLTHRQRVTRTHTHTRAKALLVSFIFFIGSSIRLMKLTAIVRCVNMIHTFDLLWFFLLNCHSLPYTNMYTRCTYVCMKFRELWLTVAHLNQLFLIIEAIRWFKYMQTCMYEYPHSQVCAFPFMFFDCPCCSLHAHSVT